VCAVECVLETRAHPSASPYNGFFECPDWGLAPNEMRSPCVGPRNPPPCCRPVHTMPMARFLFNTLSRCCVMCPQKQQLQGWAVDTVSYHALDGGTRTRSATASSVSDMTFSSYVSTLRGFEVLYPKEWSCIVSSSPADPIVVQFVCPISERSYKRFSVVSVCVWPPEDPLRLQPGAFLTPHARSHTCSHPKARFGTSAHPLHLTHGGGGLSLVLASPLRHQTPVRHARYPYVHAHTSTRLSLAHTCVKRFSARKCCAVGSAGRTCPGVG
jgi:hypothetical protein